jgi:hypothetical protein
MAENLFACLPAGKAYYTADFGGQPNPDKPDQNQKLKASLAEHAEDAELKTKARKSFMANYFLIFSARSAPLREIILLFCKEFDLLVTTSSLVVR